MFSVEQIEKLRTKMGDLVVETPVVDWDLNHSEVDHVASSVSLKLENFQRSGSFKSRGALSNLISLSNDEKARGVVAVSTGNHAIGVSYASNELGVDCLVIMPAGVSPKRIETCRRLGASVELVEDLKACYALADQIIDQQGRYYVHQYEGERTVLGSATLGLEWATQNPNLDAVIVPVGGGGLIAGISAAFDIVQPDCQVYGIEPEGSAVISASIAAGEVVELDTSQTIADSLAVIKAEPYTTSLVEQYVDGLFTVSEDQIRSAMRILLSDLKLGVEPAAAVATAGLLGPLEEFVVDGNVGVLVCGSNIDQESYVEHIGAP